MLIDNKWCDSISGREFVSINPASEEEITAIPLASKEDVDAAVTSSRRAFKEWKKTTPQERAGLLNQLANLLEENKDEIARLETLDMGKPLRESYTNIARSVTTARYYAGAADKFEGNSYPVDSNTYNFSVYEPLGVTAHITPWNYPLANVMRSLPTAIAAGCTVIVKPALDTTLSSLFLAKLCVDAGFPPGVINVISGSGTETGAALAQHPGVAGITFTGSVSTGTKNHEVRLSDNKAGRA